MKKSENSEVFVAAQRGAIDIQICFTKMPSLAKQLC